MSYKIMIDKGNLLKNRKSYTHVLIPVLVLFTVLSFLCSISRLQASELRPYAPPVQSQQKMVYPSKASDELKPTVQPAQGEAKYLSPTIIPSESAKGVDDMPCDTAGPVTTREDYYKRFAEQTAGLKQTKRDVLKKDLINKMKTAQTKNEWDDVSYYSRLIDILNKGGKK